MNNNTNSIQKLYNPLINLFKRIKMNKIQYGIAFGMGMLGIGAAMMIASYCFRFQLIAKYRFNSMSVIGYDVG